MENNKQKEVTYSIVKLIGVIEERKDGWNKEINLVSWNGGPTKFDIRDWDPDHERMTRGITLFEETARELMKRLQEYFGEDR